MCLTALQIQSIVPTPTGFHAVLGLVSNSSSIFGTDIGPLNMDVFYETRKASSITTVG